MRVSILYENIFLEKQNTYNDIDQIVSLELIDEYCVLLFNYSNVFFDDIVQKIFLLLFVC
jgi:hypothetical protein